MTRVEQKTKTTQEEAFERSSFSYISFVIQGPPGIGTYRRTHLMRDETVYSRVISRRYNFDFIPH